MAVDRKVGTVSDYRAYLVRCWREGDGWRFSLDKVGENRRRHGYRHIAQVFAAIAADFDDEWHEETGQEEC